MGGVESKGHNVMHTESSIATEAFLNELANNRNTEEFLNRVRSQIKSDPTFSATSYSATSPFMTGGDCGAPKREYYGGADTETGTVTADKLMQELVRLARSKQQGGNYGANSSTESSTELSSSDSASETANSDSSLGFADKKEELDEMATEQYMNKKKKVEDDSSSSSSSSSDKPSSTESDEDDEDQEGGSSESFTVTSPYEMSDVTIDTPVVSVEKVKKSGKNKKRTTKGW